MIRRQHIGRLGMALLALGVVPLPSSEREVDLKAAERALDALSAAGISAPEVLEFAGGPERFAALASVCIANNGQAEVLSAVLHPCGYCRCGGEGACQWCVMKAKRAADRAAAEAKHEAVCEVRRQNREKQASARKVRQGKKSKRGF